LERAAGEGDAEDRLLECAVLLAQPLGAAVLALVVAPDAVIRLVERAGQVSPFIGQRKTLAAAPFLFGEPQHRDAVAHDRPARYKMLHVEAMRHLEQHAAT